MQGSICQGDRILEYSIDGDISFAQIAQKPVFRDELVEYVFSISKQLVSIIQNGLKLDKIVWDVNSMFVKFVDFSVQLLYLPLECNFENRNIGQFLTNCCRHLYTHIHLPLSVQIR